MTKQEKMQELRVFAEQIRLETLKIIGARGFGHVGGSMSLAETMAVVYGAYMNIDPKNPVGGPRLVRSLQRTRRPCNVRHFRTEGLLSCQ